MPSLIKRALRKILTPLLWNCTSAELQCGRLAYSQFGEDVMCGYFFTGNYRGTYVDVGAFHPIQFSNTYGFYRQGWRGVAIDANPELASLFARFRPDDVFVHSAVGAQAGHIEMAMFPDGTLNCMADQLEQVPEKLRETARLVRVPINSLARLLAEQQVQTIDLLNVDCEGNDLNVLHSNDWSRWRPKVICVEDHSADWQQSETASYLKDLGYTLKYRAVFTSIFVENTILQARSTDNGLLVIA